MAEIRVPDLSEEVAEATVGEWLKAVGDTIQAGDVILVLETDKVNMEVEAEVSGVLQEIVAPEGQDVVAGDVLAIISGDAAAPAQAQTPQSQPAPTAQPAQAAPAPAAMSGGAASTPVAQRVAQAHNVDINQVPARDGKRVTKEDVEAYVQQQGAPQAQPVAPAPKPAAPKPAPKATSNGSTGMSVSDRPEERIKMSRRRRTIAKRLTEAQATAAMLTTFNEIDMHNVMQLRSRRKDAFKEKFGVSLGLSSFFVKATIGALKAFPRLNAEIDDSTQEMILKQYYDIGIAIGAEEGLIVPVLRNADRLTFAEIEKQIRVFAKQVDEGTLPLDALMGGTFSITNGGVFGSMMSTPILNTPQVGILGLHGIKDRPVVVDGEITIRPMMYVALTYDHRIVDGREAVQFLVRVKDLIEDPEILLIEG